MPRQLPWLNKRGGSGAQAKHAPKASNKKSAASDDDFFDGTVLASSSKGRGRAVPDEEASDDDLPALSLEPSTERTKSKGNNAVHKERAPSSSPPAMADLEQPQIESMHKGFSKFDLRDDEWMMVEDEFLETAKLFTRHLHMAEYERLKERIEEKKNEADVARPVVVSAKLSFESTMKGKARVQEKRQRKAIQDVFASQNESDDAEDDAAPMRPPPSKAASSLSRAHPGGGSNTSKRTTKAYPARDTDSDDDLDAPQRRAKLTAASGKETPTTSIPARAPTHHATPPPKPAAAPSPVNTTAFPSFAKPAPPQPPAAKPRSRTSRATPFDILDDYTPRKTNNHATRNPPVPPHEQREPRISSLSSLSATSTRQSSSTPAKPPALATPDEVKKGRTRPSVDLFDDWGAAAAAAGKKQGGSSVGSTSESQSTARLVKRRGAEREKEDQDKSLEKKRKAVKLDDIPTFLV